MKLLESTDIKHFFWIILKIPRHAAHEKED